MLVMENNSRIFKRLVFISQLLFPLSFQKLRLVIQFVRLSEKGLEMVGKLGVSGRLGFTYSANLLIKDKSNFSRPAFLAVNES